MATLKKEKREKLKYTHFLAYVFFTDYAENNAITIWRRGIDENVFWLFYFLFIFNLTNENNESDRSNSLDKLSLHF